MASSLLTLGGGVAHSDQSAPGSVSSSFKDLTATAKEVVCVSYTDAFSVGNNSLVDVQIGCRHNVVSSNQDVLDRTADGNLAVVRSESGYAVIGMLGPHIPDCKVWADRGGGHFKYARQFTPITKIFPIKTVQDKWKAVCEVHEVPKAPMNLFNMRLCGYGPWYIPAIRDALRLDIFPIRTSADATHTTFA